MKNSIYCNSYVIIMICTLWKLYQDTIYYLLFQTVWVSCVWQHSFVNQSSLGLGPHLLLIILPETQTCILAELLGQAEPHTLYKLITYRSQKVWLWLCVCLSVCPYVHPYAKPNIIKNKIVTTLPLVNLWYSILLGIHVNNFCNLGEIGYACWV